MNFPVATDAGLGVQSIDDSAPCHQMASLIFSAWASSFHTFSFPKPQPQPQSQPPSQADASNANRIERTILRIMFSSSNATKYSLTSLANLSPRDNYVQVQTPASGVAVDAALTTVQDAYTEADAYRCYAGAQDDNGEDHDLSDNNLSVDTNGLRMYSWSSGLNERDLSSPYFWFACCCPCITVPQLEVRMGLNTFKCAAFSFFVSQITLIGLWVLLTVTMWAYLRGEGDSIQWTLMLVAFFAVQIVLIASRIASLRSKVRARFVIPGTSKQDFQLAVFHPTHSVYQIAKHLACDRVRPCAAPTTLPAYEV